jgi:hypothetical protein
VYADFDLILLNTGAHTHLCLGPRASSALDLTFCSPGTAAHFDWSVLPDLHGSDHYRVNLHMTTPSPAVSSPAKCIIRRADWVGLSQSLRFENQNFPSVDSTVEYFTSTVLRAATPFLVAHPVRCGLRNFATHFALTEFRAHLTLGSLISFKRFRAKAQRVIL